MHIVRHKSMTSAYWLPSLEKRSSSNTKILLIFDNFVQLGCTSILRYHMLSVPRHRTWVSIIHVVSARRLPLVRGVQGHRRRLWWSTARRDSGRVPKGTAHYSDPSTIGQGTGGHRFSPRTPIGQSGEQRGRELNSVQPFTDQEFALHTILPLPLPPSPHAASWCVSSRSGWPLHVTTLHSTLFFFGHGQACFGPSPACGMRARAAPVLSIINARRTAEAWWSSPCRPTDGWLVLVLSAHNCGACLLPN